MVIFAAGVVTGGLLVRHVQTTELGQESLRRVRTSNIQRVAQPVSAGGMRFEFLRRIQRDLDLTTEQREQIDKILKESQEHARKIMEPVAPEMRAEVQRTTQKFREVLTPEQQARFDKLIKRPAHPRDQHRQAGQSETLTTNSVR